MNIDGSSPRLLTGGLDRPVASPAWSADGRSIYVLYDEHGSNRVARVGLDGSVRDVATGLTGSGLDRPYSGGEFSVSRDGRIAVTAGNPARPSDIALASGGSMRRLTQLNESGLGAKVLGEVTKLPVASSFDQRPIDAWIVTPPDFDPNKKYPLILEIHGGPFAAYGPTFSTDDQLYAAAGYVGALHKPARVNVVRPGLRRPDRQELSRQRL